MTLMSCSRNNLPVIPVGAQDGENRCRYASVAPARFAQRSAAAAPASKMCVMSRPKRVRVSTSVSYTLPRDLRTGERGQRNPANISGQMGTTAIPEASSSRICVVLDRTVPSHRQRSPQRQAEATTIFGYMGFSSWVGRHDGRRSSFYVSPSCGRPTGNGPPHRLALSYSGGIMTSIPA